MKQVIRRIETVYMILLGIYLPAREVIPLNDLIGKTAVSAAVFALAFCFLIWELIQNKSFFRTHSMDLLILFAGITGVSVLVNHSYELTSNVKGLGVLMINCFLLYTIGANRVGEEKKPRREVGAFLTSAYCTWIFFVILSLPMYFFTVDYEFKKVNNTITNQGFSMEYRRLWGLFQEANYAAVYSVVAILLSVLLFRKTKSKAVRVLLVIGDVFAFLFTVLSGSRTALVILLVVAVWLGLYLFAKKLPQKNPLRILLAVALSVVCAGASYGVYQAVRLGLPYAQVAVASTTPKAQQDSIHRIYDSAYRVGNVNVISGFLDKDEPSEKTDKDDETDTTDESDTDENAHDPQSLDRTDLIDGKDRSNGRLRRWKDGFAIFMKNPILGTSPKGVNAWAHKNLPETYVGKYFFSISNVFIELLAGTGVFGFLTMLAFLLLGAVGIVLFAVKKPLDPDFALEAAAVLALAVSIVFESDLIFLLSMGSGVFWLLFGSLSARWEVNRFHFAADLIDKLLKKGKKNA